MGGEKAIKAVNTRVMKGVLDIPGVSRGGTFESYQQAPNKGMSLFNAHPFGTVKAGYNGRVAWLHTAAGVQPVKNPGELAATQRETDIYSTLRVKANYAKVSLLGMSQIGYRDMYVLDLQPAVGAAERLYLDAKTYLPARINTVRKIGATAEPVEIYLDEWKAVDGIQIPFSVSQRFSGITLAFTVKEVLHNVPLAASLFEQPVK